MTRTVKRHHQHIPSRCHDRNTVHIKKPGRDRILCLQQSHGRSAMYAVPKWTNRGNFVASATVTAVFFSPLLLLFFSVSSSLSPRKSESLSRTHAVNGADCHYSTRASCSSLEKTPGHETGLYLARSGWRAQIHRELSYWENITSDQLLSFEKSLNENEFSGLRVVIINN